MTPERAKKILEAVTEIRADLPFFGMLIDTIPGAAPFERVAEAGLSKIFEIASVYYAKQGKEAEDEIRDRLVKDWAKDTGAEIIVE